MHSTVLLWAGPSRLDGSPILMFASGIRRPSKNAKTGEMIQTWILPRALPPHEAQKAGADASICGDCPLRPFLAKIARYRPELAAGDEAARLGWRTFRVVSDASRITSREILCPASAEAGRRTTCARCGLCDGARGKTDHRKRIAIVDHGHGACYVKTFQAPRSLWAAWERGNVPRATPADWTRLRGRAIRLGAYGDPAAVPESILRRLATLASTHTGYTHQWRRFPALSDILMASV